MERNTFWPYSHIFDIIRDTKEKYPELYLDLMIKHDSVVSTYDEYLNNLDETIYPMYFYEAAIDLYENYMRLYSAVNCSDLNLIEASNVKHIS